MQWDIIAAVMVTATIQSIFGVGVLLFGTPILLVLGYEFMTALTILLPISLAINVLQVSKHARHIDLPFYMRILSLSVPCIVISLFLVSRAKISIGPIVGLFLIVVALKSAYAPFNRFIESLVRYERLYFAVMGIIHGLTNLGGSLLTAIVHSKPMQKDVARVTTAAAYGTFALFQLLTLLLSGGAGRFAMTSTAAYMTLGVGMFLATETLLYGKLSTERYRETFAVFLFVSGTVLIFKAFLL